jgi:hypothetical protein
MSFKHAAGARRLTILAATVAIGLAAPAGASAAIDLSVKDIKITDVTLTPSGTASWRFEFPPLKTDRDLPADAALLRVQLDHSAILRPLHGTGFVAGSAGQDRFTGIPAAGGNPLFRRGAAFVALDSHDPDWAQIVRFKKARLSVEISIVAEVVSAKGKPLSPRLTDKEVARGTAIVTIPRSVLAAHR